ncbi:hypothetical protein BSL78_29436 [Apostichopus japonicus]|uniref:Uncharacterized protein n=1 Tax=Stichopus japonicus TaxID=307972 RepID=A0A2G8JDD5_STIJA|nr:hypothetical protein BSL78_29436 [Apostichopus japonicus]
MFALLLHCEDKLDETYSMRAVAGESFQLDPDQSWHKSDEFACPQTFRSVSDLQHSMWDNNADSTMRNVKGVTTGKHAIIRGMIPAWKLLYQKTVTMYIVCNKHVQKHSRDETILSRIKSFLMNMIGVIQRKLSSIGYHASLHLHHFWTAEQNETYLKGCERFLLGDFRGGVECCWAACNSSKQQDKTSVTIPIFREDCRGVVMSMARFMALYFTNKPLIIYPPTSAKPLPVLFSENEGDVRTIVLHRHLIANKIQEQGLSIYWTPDLTLSLLLIGGLFPEAIWFSKEVGDWRSAFTLSVIYSMKYDHLTADGSHRNREELRLPDSLTASSLMCERLVALTQVPDNGLYTEQEESSGCQTFGFVEISDEAEDKLRKALLSIFLAGTLSGIELVPWLLGSILQQCLLTAYRLSSVVHEKYYLPAPPYYCPQPDYTPVEEDPVEVIQETTSRRKITLLVKQFLIVLEASNCSRVSARWYVEQLDNVQTWAYAKKRSESQDLPSALHQHVNFVLDIMDGTEAPDDIQPGTKFILKCFRDLCSLLWMLHLRDKLSEALRRGKIARYMLQICKVSEPS